MPRIFISYRRSDSRTITGRIHDRLVAEFGRDNVFKDVDDIPFGTDFRRVLEQAVSETDILLVIVGPTWATVTDDKGNIRLEDPNDFVRIEVESALRSPRATVIPVLVQGAQALAGPDLPGGILREQLPYINAPHVREDPDFHRDMDRLIERIRALDHSQPVPGQGEHVSDDVVEKKSDDSGSSGGPNIQIVVAIIGLVGVILAALIGILPALIDNQAPTPDMTATHVLTQTAQAVAMNATATIGVPMATFLTGVNVRSGPGTTFEPPIGSLAANDKAEVLAVSPDGAWYKVHYLDREGWVLGELLAITGDTDGLPVDSGPSTPVVMPTDTPTDLPTITATDTPPSATSTFTLEPPTVTQIAQLDMTATEAVLQQTVDALETRNAETAATSTAIALAAAATPDPNIVTLTIFRDGHSFTLHVPASEQSLSLAGLEFRVNVSADETLVRRLDTDYAAFLGLPFSNISSLGAVCLRLVQASSNEPVPQACQSSTLLIPQQLATADLFWLDTAARLERTVFVYLDDALLGVCGPGDSCAVRLPVGDGGATSTAVPTAAVRGYPCEGTIVSVSGGAVVVRSLPQMNVEGKSTLAAGTSVQIVGQQPGDGSIWYQIRFNDNTTGWVRSENVQRSLSCA